MCFSVFMDLPGRITGARAALGNILADNALPDIKKRASGTAGNFRRNVGERRFPDNANGARISC
jgi:hypothetical protein